VRRCRPWPELFYRWLANDRNIPSNFDCCVVVADYPVEAMVPDLIEPISETLSSWWEGLLRLLPNLIVALLVMAAAIGLARGLARLTAKALDSWTDNATLCQVLVTTVRIGVVAVGLFIALGVLELDKTVTSLLAGVGVVGLALGFAFQDIVANYISGVIMGLRQPLHLGDLIEVQGVIGTVRGLSLRATTIETFNGQLAIVPNKDVLQSVMTNYSELGYRRVDVEVGVAYDADLERVQAVVLAAVEALEARAADRPVRVFFTGFADSSIDLVAHVWIDLERGHEFLVTRSEVIKAIKRAFGQAGITIPFPIRTLDFGADEVGGKTVGEVLQSEEMPTKGGSPQHQISPRVSPQP
jgi:small conductance mechanosensitive channel